MSLAPPPAPDAPPSPQPDGAATALPPLTALRQTLRRIWVVAAVWTVSVGGLTAWGIADQLEDQRREQLGLAQQRLDSLHETLDLSFRQLTSLPQALARHPLVTEP
ncbi:hypothetical protein, partial [Aquabacterium sp. UBA2148]|uniref:hypothetical protein n=1 Tax=Aquabacterium sp. UBA2148 TaxID=1946042 RepID=UPI002580877A